MMLAVLGEVGVRRSDGTNQPLRGKPGRVLAALVARSGRPASVDTLTEVLWGASPPASARSALHVHLSALRRFLGAVGPGAPVISIRNGGYVLDLGDAEVDAVRFEELVGEARLRRGEDPGACTTLLHEALALWRGTPYACDGEDPVDAPAAWRLDLLRLEAEELLADALVAAERTWEAESLLARLVVDEPFREVRWAILMVARYRAGRQRDALRTYQEAREVLAGELGVDPGPLLQGLERAVLVHDGSILGRSPIDVTGGVGVAPLPRPGPALVGRAAELERCRAALAERGTVVVTGPPGVGKTRLALEVAHTHPGAAAVWVDLAAVTGAGVVDALAAALGRPGRLASDLWGALRSRADHLVVLDNAEHVAGEVEELVDEIQRRVPGARVLVTTRRRLRVDGAVEEVHPFPLPPATADADALERHPAVQLFRQAARDSLGARGVEGHGTDAVVGVCRRMGGLPLSIRLAAAAARARSLSELAGGGPDEVTSGVRHAVEASLDLLTPLARRTFVSMGPVAGDVDGQTAAALAGVDVEGVAPALTELVDHHLVEADTRAEPVRYRLAEPIREVVGAVAVEQRREGEILDRLADHCLCSARAAAGGLRDRSAGALERVLADAPHHRRALGHLAATGDAGRALALACALSDPWYVAGRWRERIDWLDLALAVPGPPTRARVRTMIHRVRGGTWSSIAAQLGVVEEAECLAGELDAPDELAYLRYFRGMASWWLGDVDGALALYRAALEHFDGIGAAYESFETMKFIGVALVHRGQEDEGVALQREALAGVREVGAEFSVAHGLALLGHSHRSRGDDAAAFSDLVEARDVCRAVGSRGTTIHVLLGLAEIAADQGRPDRAFEHARAALELVEESENRTYEPWAWTIVARAAHHAGDHDGAIGALRRGVRVLDEAPPGDAARLAREAAAVALAVGEVHRAARLLGAAEACEGPREIPFPAPAEEARWGALSASVREAAGRHADELLATGRRCTPAEAAGELLATP